MSNLTITTGPVIEPITLGEVKEHLRVDDDNDDAYLDMLRVAARQLVEEWTDRALINTVFLETFSVVPDPWTLADTIDTSRVFPSRLTLRKAIPRTITSVAYYNSSEVLTTWDAANYRLVSPTDRRGWIELASSGTWPAYDTRTDAVQVGYTAGYGANPGAIPEPVRMALLQVVAGLYEHREPALVGATPAAMDALGVRAHTVEALLMPYRVLV